MFGFVTFLFFTAFSVKRLLSYLHIYQQEDYDPKRFIKWIRLTQAVDKKLSAIIVVLALLSLFMSPAVTQLGLIAALGAFIWLEKNPLTRAKKALVLTSRAKRLLGISIFLTALITLAVAMRSEWLLLWLIPVHVIPFTLIGATRILDPYEKRVNAGFRAQAVQILENINPLIIGITGSYGKTSVKHILGHILQYLAPTLITPGSVNTEMGIVRIVREQLKPHHTFFVVEMGAYGVGSIARLCRLTPPKLSVITAIGAAHYERFKTLEDTARAKFEIADATIKQGGKTIIHDSVLGRQYARDFYNGHKKDIIVCGTKGDAVISNINQHKGGLTIHVQWQGINYTLEAPLFGLHQVGNIVLSFLVATELGMSPEDAITAIRSLPQIKHRLEVKNTGHYTIIDDAYNSNPEGFTAALETLDLLGRDTRRILITPGMVELGAKHDEEHEILGKLAAKNTDIALVVKADRIPTFTEAFKNSRAQLIEVASFAEAQNWLHANGIANDVVLLENDLPDLYEKKLAL